MANAKGLIAIIPWSSFKWTAQIQYKQSLYTQDEAIRYASRHGYNSVVKYEKRSGPLFDVLQDPDTVFTSEEGYETVEVRAELAEPESTGFSKSMFRGVFGLARRLVAGGSTSQRKKAMPPAPSQALAVK